MLLIIDYSFVQTLRPCARERVSVEWEGYTTSSTRYGGSRAIVTCAAKLSTRNWFLHTGTLCYLS